MKHLAPAHRRLTVAAAVALAVTAGGLTTPALASAPAAAPAAVTAELPATPVTLDPASGLRGWGRTGFLSRVGEEREVPTFRWTRYKDGVTTPLPASATLYRASMGGDVVVRPEGTSYHLHDMAAGGAPVTIDTAFLGSSATLAWVADRTLVMQTKDGSGRTTLHLVSEPQDPSGAQAAHRVVTGFPADAKIVSSSPSAYGLLAVSYTGTVNGLAGKRLAVVDLAAGKVVDDRSVRAQHTGSGYSASATHVAWVERLADGRSVVVTARRGQTATVRHTVAAQDEGVSLALVGDWVLYGVLGGATAETANPLHALRAVPVGGGTPFVLLDSVELTYGGSGELLAQGGTVAKGEGVYRIVPGTGGKPVATQIATTGLRTALGVVEQTVPSVADFSAAGSVARFSWKLGRSRAVVDLRITHSGQGGNPREQRVVLYETRPSSPGFGRAVLDWDGLLRSQESAPAGSYSWTMTATPTNGIGGVLKRTGTFKVTNKPVQHDYSASAFPDVLARSTDGELLSYDTRQILFWPNEGAGWGGTNRGGGWNAYDRILATGDLDSTPYSDLVARDRSGVLWFYSNKGTSLAKRTAIGGGWNAYDKLAAGSDLTGDGRPDLVATDRSGVLWLYKATGSASKPFAPRERIGGGWGAYDNVTAPGNLGGATHGDLLARDRAGVLWLYLGRGDGTFAPRTRIGAGWGSMEHLVPVGDFGRDGRADLVAASRAGDGRPFLLRYKGTGDWRAPFEKAVTTQVDTSLHHFDLLF
ncbi:FG-GAP-like repeat-containing protein [Streptomyces sp. NPDC055051]